jgi:DNA polymerase-3 subunit alpha
VEEKVAEAIFTDWEKFARYGFNKAHAADYGLISVQTAYLKTHYPVEYMAAVLTVYQSNTDKVTLYASECRQMGIEVLAPNVNYSCYGFTIENGASGENCIRFGLGAVKNVGEGPVEEIIKGRGEVKFQDVNDFLRRVDLRKVGKRALESLIQVGALDDFGNRPSLLESMDRILSISSSNFQAADAGQISMFGDGTGLTEVIRLPDAQVPINRRAQLDWERELIGLYVSDHPLSTVMDNLKQHVTHFAQDLNEAKHQERVRVAGIVSKIRQHQTKNGKTMAFATIEDIQGMIDLVIFPKTWEKFNDLVRFDEIIYVKGKADANGGDTKVLVDQVSTNLSMVEPIDNPPSATEPPGGDDYISEPVSTNVPQPAEEEDHSHELDPNNGFPFPPEDPSIESQNHIPQANEETVVSKESSSQGTEQSLPPAMTEPVIDEEIHTTTLDAEPKLDQEKDLTFVLDEDSTYLMTIILKNRGDTLRDKLRLRQIYGTLISYPGRDRFVFQITENDQSHLLEFPNASTKVSKNLINQLRDMLGRENVQIEKYLL